MSAEPKFLADSMLGKIARWLILLGYDARYAGADGRKDSELLAQAQSEGRVFITRDTGIPEVKGLRKIVLRQQRFEDQLRQILGELKLKPERWKFFSRCTYCNQELKPLPRAEALPLVPPLVKTLNTAFYRCPTCSRIYWSGTHTEKTIKKLESL